MSLIYISGMNDVTVEAGLKCCFSNRIDRCIVKQDDAKCDALCRSSNCGKGGFCKIEGKTNYCHCYC